MRYLSTGLALAVGLILASSVEAAGVARAQFTTGIEAREPIDSVTELTNDIGRVIFFTELTGLEGQEVIHRWEYGGQVMAEVSLTIGGSRWRVWSSKNLVPSWTGEWRVAVVNEAGEVLSEDRLNYRSAGE